MRSLPNGKKRELLEKITTYIKLLFSEELLAEVAKELEAESLAREAAREEEAAKQQQHTNGFNPSIA